jgi:serine/threonine protein kinase
VTKAINVINDRYTIGRQLGQGSNSITYEAIDRETNIQVAIKVVSLTQLDDWKKIELFEREAKILQQLNHSAIPKYLDYFQIETQSDLYFYLVQEQAPGKSLFQLVESGWHATETEVKNIARQILAILNYLHSLDPPIIHRDIKPNNLIRSEDGTIYLVDFGAVQNTYYNTLMRGSTVVGTYGYMAPEQFRGKALPASDLYSLGATLLYLLTHRSPAELPQDTLKLDFRNSVNISESFADWLEKILEPDLDDRFASAEVALTKLLATKKVKQKKLLARLGIGVLIISSIVGLNSYKWGFLSRLGYLPDGLCDNITVMDNYLKKGGNINLVIDRYGKSDKTILQCIFDTLTRMGNDADFGNATFFEKEQIFKLLVKRGADFNNGDIDRESFIFFEEDREIVELLIKYGADVNAKNDNGATPLFIAVDRGNLDIVELLIQNGAEINVRDNSGQTPLFYATERGHEDIVKENIAKLLIECGALINIKDNYGKTPLSIAAFRQDKKLVQLLINKGADLSYLINNKYEDDYDREAKYFIESIKSELKK